MFYFPGFLRAGTEMGILNLIKSLTNYEIIVAYIDEASSPAMLEEMSKYAKVINIAEESFDTYEVDTLVTCRYYNNCESALDKIKRKRTFFWLHTTGNFFLSHKVDFTDIDKIIFVSQTSKEKMIEIKPGNQKVTDGVVINNLVNFEEILFKSQEKLDVEFDDELKIITVARFSPLKGYGRMAHLAQQLKDRKVNFKWYVIASDNPTPAGREAAKTIKELLAPHRDCFVFLGEQTNPYKFIKQCDYLALLSDRETWGIVITEAKILGVPCIVTNFATAHEQITDDVNGVILDLDDLGSYQTRLDDILERRDYYKENLKNFNYDEQTIINAWHNLLQES